MTPEVAVDLFREGLWMTAMIVGGLAVPSLLGGLVVAVFAGAIGNSLEGVGQETFNAVILLGAVLMLAWHNIWMAQHGKELAMRMSTIGKNVLAGQEPMYALTIAIGLAVLREGAEVVLFLNGIAAGGEGAAGLMVGSLSGVALGMLAGYLLYTGLVRIPVKQFFSVTGWMILLLASGLAASAAGYLEQAGWVPALKYTVWDTSSVLSEQSLSGQRIHTLI